MLNLYNAQSVSRRRHRQRQRTSCRPPKTDYTDWTCLSVAKELNQAYPLHHQAQRPTSWRTATRWVRNDVWVGRGEEVKPGGMKKREGRGKERVSLFTGGGKRKRGPEWEKRIKAAGGGHQAGVKRRSLNYCLIKVIVWRDYNRL